MSSSSRSVLDKGFVELQEVMGNELTAVNCARVSFGKQKTVMEDEDVRLTRYLIRNKHFSPFRHIMFRFHIKAPEFVMRQWFKHVIGAEWSAGSYAPFHSWNEISGRYVKLEDVHTPDEWRKQSISSKQGSDGIMAQDSHGEICALYETTIQDTIRAYNTMLEKGVAREMARVILPLSIYTETIWTCSFQAVMNFLELRLDPHAQKEIREYALAVESLVKDRFPVLTTCWLETLEKK